MPGPEKSHQDLRSGKIDAPICIRPAAARARTMNEEIGGFSLGAKRGNGGFICNVARRHAKRFASKLGERIR